MRKIYQCQECHQIGATNTFPWIHKDKTGHKDFRYITLRRFALGLLWALAKLTAFCCVVIVVGKIAAAVWGIDQYMLGVWSGISVCYFIDLAIKKPA